MQRFGPRQRTEMNELSVFALPRPLQWRVVPDQWGLDNEQLTIVAGEQTDWFSDPGGRPSKDNAPCALMIAPDAEFLLSAKVRVDFESTFDAGLIQVRASNDAWAKLCFEFAPDRRPMVVSVVTHGLSDDCNSAVIEGNEVNLRVAVNQRSIVFHYSLDGQYWHFVRHFSLGHTAELQVGFSAQSPTGKQCRAMFSDIQYRAGRLLDIRNGE